MSVYVQGDCLNIFIVNIKKILKRYYCVVHIILKSLFATFCLLA